MPLTRNDVGGSSLQYHVPAADISPSQQKASVLSHQQTAAASEVAWRPWRGPGQNVAKPSTFCVFELANLLFRSRGANVGVAEYQFV